MYRSISLRGLFCSKFVHCCYRFRVFHGFETKYLLSLVYQWGLDEYRIQKYIRPHGHTWNVWTPSEWSFENQKVKPSETSGFLLYWIIFKTFFITVFLLLLMHQADKFVEANTISKSIEFLSSCRNFCPSWCCRRFAHHANLKK